MKLIYILLVITLLVTILRPYQMNGLISNGQEKIFKIKNEKVVKFNLNYFNNLDRN